MYLFNFWTALCSTLSLLNVLYINKLNKGPFLQQENNVEQHVFIKFRKTFILKSYYSET